MKKDKQLLILFIVIGIILSETIVYAQETLFSKNIFYDNSESTLSSTNVQAAIDELTEKSKTYCPPKYKCYELKKSPEPGDYVQMTPTLTSYTTDTGQTGYTSSQTINPSELNLWRVLRVNSDGTIEMISEYVSSTEVYFKGLTGYQNVVGYLNVLASKYENSVYTKGSRHVGYNGQTEYITDLSKITSTTAPWTSDTGRNTVESQGGGDLLYENDTDLIYDVIGTLKASKVNSSSSTKYWLASREYTYIYTDISTYNWSYRSRYVDSRGYSSFSDYLYLYDSNIGFTNLDCNYALRPIVILKPGISYQPVLGTSDDPFVLK